MSDLARRIAVLDYQIRPDSGKGLQCRCELAVGRGKVGAIVIVEFSPVDSKMIRNAASHEGQTRSRESRAARAF